MTVLREFHVQVCRAHKVRTLPSPAACGLRCLAQRSRAAVSVDGPITCCNLALLIPSNGCSRITGPESVALASSHFGNTHSKAVFTRHKQ